jgi:hypothetical protein
LALPAPTVGFGRRGRSADRWLLRGLVVVPDPGTGKGDISPALTIPSPQTGAQALRALLNRPAGLAQKLDVGATTARSWSLLPP